MAELRIVNNHSNLLHFGYRRVSKTLRSGQKSRTIKALRKRFVQVPKHLDGIDIRKTKLRTDLR